MKLEIEQLEVPSASFNEPSDLVKNYTSTFRLIRTVESFSFSQDKRKITIHTIACLSFCAVINVSRCS